MLILSFRLPWRRFALDDDDAAASESEEEILDKSLKPAPSSSDSKTVKDLENKTEQPSSSHKKVSSSQTSKSSKSPKKSSIGIPFHH